VKKKIISNYKETKIKKKSKIRQLFLVNLKLNTEKIKAMKTKMNLTTIKIAKMIKITHN
jgi:hypothetical protein